MKPPLSVCVLACDEAQALERCLGSVRDLADEMVVLVDAKSQDETESVARRLATTVAVAPYAGDLAQKQACVAMAKNDWVLALDPDEVPSPELVVAMREALLAVMAAEGPSATEGAGSDEAIVGFRLNRLTFHLGRWIRHGDFYPDWKLRLFRKDRVRWTGQDPHGRAEAMGRVADLSPELFHYSYRDLADQVRRIQFFSGEAAAAMFAAGEPFRLRRLLLHPPARFLRAYVLKQGFRDGLPGFMIAVATAFYVFLKYAKHWERTQSLAAD